ncbi:chaperone protein dnaJ 1, mitochondrial isoform X2 [Macadamia integrifolia]|uniref:chaperone protein dnaJ 1, mitochondrial isoform X2 n=1 Tax=Macadamia integrifolia TaxID=60698 RepID=UPI001C4FEE77|nr:chaperone protein dnaJ 1, mitochondrial isoform X2 [Macadamia integrifolia]
MLTDTAARIPFLEQYATRFNYREVGSLPLLGATFRWYSTVGADGLRETCRRHRANLLGAVMGRFSWLGFTPKPLFQIRRFHQHFTSSLSVEFPVVNGVWQDGVPLLRRAFYGSRTFHGCSFESIGRPTSFSATGLRLIGRYFHATGVCHSIEQGYYQILGVPKEASRDEIRKAFHELAKKYHPDANKNNPAAKRKFQEIRNAYETLRDPERRAQYDREHSRGSRSRDYAAADSEGFTYGSYAYRDHFSDSFHKIFSEIFENETESFASDIQVELSLSFSEASKGCTKHLSFDAHVPCDSCNGRGHPINAKAEVCPTCRGIGRVTIPPFTSTCSTCKGFGRIIKEYCITCRGSGMVEGVKEVKVTIPAGVDSGDTIRVPKAGNSGGRGVQPGTLYIKLKVDKDNLFLRDGADIYVDTHISFTQAIIGGMVDVPTLSGKLQIKIPKGVQHGQLLVLRGRGLPKQGILTDHGDQYVRFRIHLPTSLNERQRALLEEFALDESIHGSSTSDEGNWWQQIIDRLTDSRFMLQIMAFLLIILLLNKSIA